MTKYIYKAKKRNAETVSGQINANTQDEAVDLINQLGLTPISVFPEEAGAVKQKAIKVGKVPKKEVYLFSRQLANLLRSGVSLLKSLNIIEEQSNNAYFQQVIYQLALGIKNGKSFSECLTAYPHIFSSLYVTMIHAGEESGNLRDMLINVSVYQKEQEEIRSKVRTALIYPVFMAFVGFLSVYFILTFVVPKMAGLFSNMGNELPLPTIILLSISEFLSKGWLWIVCGLGIILFLAQKWIRSQTGKIMLSSFFLKVPLFGEIILKIELARFCKTLVLLLRSGVSIVNAIKMAVPILENEVIKEHFSQCEKALVGGGSFGSSIRKSEVIPPMMGHLVSIGEESGNLNDVLGEISETYEQETSEKIKIMMTLLEPLMILVVGMTIGFIVFALLLPIFQVDVFAQ